MTLKGVACDYYATGEGVTICLLISAPHPQECDYEIQPSWDIET